MPVLLHWEEVTPRPGCNGGCAYVGRLTAIVCGSGQGRVPERVSGPSRGSAARPSVPGHRLSGPIAASREVAAPMSGRRQGGECGSSRLKECPQHNGPATAAAARQLAPVMSVPSPALSIRARGRRGLGLLLGASSEHRSVLVTPPVRQVYSAMISSATSRSLRLWSIDILRSISKAPSASTPVRPMMMPLARSMVPRERSAARRSSASRCWA